MIPADPSSKYASQQKVFDDLGTGVLQNAFDGFNCSLFGKSCKNLFISDGVNL